MSKVKIPTIGFSAASGVGKTTLLSTLLPLLTQQGLRVGLIKHSHHDFEIDKPGKDSYRLRKAGASPVLLISQYRSAFITERPFNTEPTLAEALKPFEQQQDLDLILIEGFHQAELPKIELHRAVLAQPLRYLNDASIIAVASDTALTLPESLTLLDLNQPNSIAHFICQRFIRT